MVNDNRVRLHSNGRYWQLVYRTTEGVRVVKSLGSKAKLTRRAAEQARDKLVADFARTPGLRDAGTCLTVEQWGKEYLRLKSDLAPGSRARVEQSIELLQEHLGKEARIDRIDRRAARGWAAWLADQDSKTRPGKIALATQRLHVRNVKAMFALAAQDDIIPFNPFDRLASGTVQVDKTWADVTHKQLEQMLEACPGPNWRSLLALCRLAGLRRGEALRLAWVDIDWCTRTLTVAHSGRRTTKRRTRIVPMSAKLHEILRAGFESAPSGSVLVCDVGGFNIDRRRPGVALVAAGGADDVLPRLALDATPGGQHGHPRPAGRDHGVGLVAVVLLRDRQTSGQIARIGHRASPPRELAAADAFPARRGRMGPLPPVRCTPVGVHRGS